MPFSLEPLQRSFEAFYGLEPAPSVDGFVRLGEQGERETLLVRTSDDALEVQLRVPRAAADLELTGGPSGTGVGADVVAQVVEGVSHFVLLVERARVELPTTQLELELQAEVDKFVYFAWPFELAPERLETHERLFSSVRYLHRSDCEIGARYRLANRLAARYTAALVRSVPCAEAKRHLRRFFRAGQAEKIRMAEAA